MADPARPPDTAHARDSASDRGLRAKVVSLRDRRPDAELVRAALDGDQRAKTELFRRYVDLVAGATYRLMGSDADLEDLVHDTFEEAFRKLHRLQQPEAFRGWLHRIAIGRTITHLRRRQLQYRLGLRRREPVALDQLVSAEAPPDVAFELRAVYGLIDRLPVADRVVLVLRRVEQQTVREIAQQTGWSVATVKRRIARATQMLLELQGAAGARLRRDVEQEDP